MTYQVEIERRAFKELHLYPSRRGQKIARQDQPRILQAIDVLADDPRPHGCRTVRAATKGTYRIRVGSYRVIYVILDEERVVIIVRVARRSEDTYKDL